MSESEISESAIPEAVTRFQPYDGEDAFQAGVEMEGEPALPASGSGLRASASTSGLTPEQLQSVAAVIGAVASGIAGFARTNPQQASASPASDEDAEDLQRIEQAIEEANGLAERIVASMDRSHDLLQDSIRELRAVRSRVEEPVAA